MSQRAFLTHVHFVYGLADIVLDLVPVRETNAAKKVSFAGICPTCTEPTKPDQQYHCSRCDGTFAPNERDKAREEGGLLFRVSDDEIAAVKAAATAEPDIDDATKVMFLRVCPLKDLLARTRPADTAYRLRLPKKGPRAFMNMLGLAASSEEYGLYGLLKMKEDGPTQPYRLEVWNGQIVLQSLVRPEDLAEIDDEVKATNFKYQNMAQMMLEQLNEPLDEALLKDGRVAKLEEILTTKDVLQAVPPALNEEDDLLSLLEASLANLKGAA